MAVTTQRRNSRKSVKSKSRGETPKRMTQARRVDELKSFVSLCFIMLEGAKFQDIAAKASLSKTTVHRLFQGNYTLAVQFGTIQKLGIAAGLRLEMTEYNAKVFVAD